MKMIVRQKLNVKNTPLILSILTGLIVCTCCSCNRHSQPDNLRSNQNNKTKEPEVQTLFGSIILDYDNGTEVQFQRVIKNEKHAEITLTFFRKQKRATLAEASFEMKILAPVVGVVKFERQGGENSNIFKGEMPGNLAFYTNHTDDVFFQIPKITIDGQVFLETEFLLKKNPIELIDSDERRKQVLKSFVDVPNVDSD